MLKLLAASTICATNVAPLFTPAPLAATLPYLKKGILQTLDGDKRQFEAGELWENNGAVIYAPRRSGCAFCRGAAIDLSSLRSEMEAKNIKLYAAVHEDMNTQEFKQYFDGDVFLDVHKTFYGPQLRFQSVLGYFSFMSSFYAWKAISRKIKGDKFGDWRLLGATFVIGPGEQGVVFQHNEFVPGNEAKISELQTALGEVKVF